MYIDWGVISSSEMYFLRTQSKKPGVSCIFNLQMCALIAEAITNTEYDKNSKMWKKWWIEIDRTE